MISTRSTSHRRRYTLACLSIMILSSISSHVDLLSAISTKCFIESLALCVAIITLLPTLFSHQQFRGQLQVEEEKFSILGTSLHAIERITKPRSLCRGKHSRVGGRIISLLQAKINFFLIVVFNSNTYMYPRKNWKYFPTPQLHSRCTELFKGLCAINRAQALEE